MGGALSREIEGFEVRVARWPFVQRPSGYSDSPLVRLAWRDHACEAELEKDGGSFIHACHDFIVPVDVLLAAADMLREKEAKTPDSR